MSLVTLRLYRVRYLYPYFGPVSDYLPASDNMTVEPNDTMTDQNGSFHIGGSVADYKDANYLVFSWLGKSHYCFINSMQHRTANSVVVNYTVDGFRTYLNDVSLGTQYIERRPEPTGVYDPLLGADKDYRNIYVKPNIMTHEDATTTAGSSPKYRTLVVVARRANIGEKSESVSPGPYDYYLCDYEMNNWANNDTISTLLKRLSDKAKPINLISLYTIPLCDSRSFTTMSLPIYLDYDREPEFITGFRQFNVDSAGDKPDENALSFRHPIVWHKTLEERIAIARTNYTAQIIIPEAGIIDVPQEYFLRDNTYLRQDIDIYSGASNYMLVSGNIRVSGHSVRGGSVGTIPIVSNLEDTYESQNQNALQTALIGDVAGIVASVGAMAIPVAGPAIGAVGLAGSIGSATKNIMSREAAKKDAGRQDHSTAPAYLGTALLSKENRMFYTYISSDPVDNAGAVHDKYGYAYGKIAPLKRPTKGFIQTSDCHVMGRVPFWALNEINMRFDEGIHFM